MKIEKRKCERCKKNKRESDFPSEYRFSYNGIDIVLGIKNYCRDCFNVYKKEWLRGKV